MIRNIMRKISRSAFCHNLVAYLIKLYILLVYYTSRWRIIGADKPAAYIDAQKPFIACFWHGRLSMIPQMWQWKTPMTALVSGHQDGILVGRIFKLFGVDYITGSTNRGGAQALRQVIRTLQAGNPIGMTPDGPRGPREIVNPGIIMMAKFGGAVMFPVSFSVARYHTFQTWDRFMLPFPFNRGVFLWGDPIHVPAETSPAEMEAYRLQLETALNKTQQQADNMVSIT